VSAASAVLTEHEYRGARVQRVLRVLLGLFLVGVLLFAPPEGGLALCWLVVACYGVWSGAVGFLIKAADARSLRYVWLALFVDMFTLVVLTLIADRSATTETAPLLLTGFFLIPVIAAAQLKPWICMVVSAPAVLVYLVSSLAIRDENFEPVSSVLLRSAVLVVVGLGCVLLSRLQRSRVATITQLLDERSALLAEMVQLEQREQRQLAETLHDGALQYVLAARQELESVEDGDPEAVGRVDLALGESSRLLRSIMTQLHPAVVETAGLLPALRDLAEALQTRRQLTARLQTRDWEDALRTPVDELLLSTARELVTNIAKHAEATQVRIELSREAGHAKLLVADDGRGMSGVDLDAKLGAGHLGLASRRIRVEAAGGSMRFTPAEPHGTVVDVTVPLIGLAAAAG